MTSKKLQLARCQCFLQRKHPCHRHPFFARFCKRQRLLEFPHQCFPRLDLRVGGIARGLAGGREVVGHVQCHHQPVAGAEDFEVANAGRADRIGDFGPDVFRPVPAFVFGDQRRVVLEVERVVKAHGVQASCERARCTANRSTAAKQPSGTSIARAMPAMSETAPVSAVSTAPPMIAITSSEAPSLRSLSLKPSTPSAKIVGYITDMKKLASTSA